MQFRIDLFRRRGRTEKEAEAWADRLCDRDDDRDDRRVCLECKNAKPQVRCAAGGYPRAGILFRCPQFSWEKP